MTTYRQRDSEIAARYLADVSAIITNATEVIRDMASIAGAITVLRATILHGKRVWIVGNGGSAATAAHFANDLTKMAKVKAISIPDQTEIITAYGNDTGWENMYDEPLYIHFAPGDVLVAISCSGRSMNVIKAARTALELEGHLIVLTGKRINNILATMVEDKAICVEANDIRIQEDVHLIICHAIAGALAEKAG